MTASSLTLPETPIEELLEDLCVELRHVAVSDAGLPSGSRVVAHIHLVKRLHSALRLRGCDPTSRVTRLSEETSWQMGCLFDDCLRFPETLPYVRETDGLRRTFRCLRCRAAERPPDAKLFWFCDGCLRAILEAVRQRRPIDDVMLFRTYDSSRRCVHADPDTVLAADYYHEVPDGVCTVCISDELSRRAEKVV
jgi:hypothetical protein